MSANLKFDFSKPLHENVGMSEENSPHAGNSIVQCTFCNTRYSVASDLLAKNDPAKFHCFSCDNVFAVDKASDSIKDFTPQVVVSPDISRVESEPKSYGFNSNLKVTSQNQFAEVKRQQEKKKISSLMSFAEKIPTKDFLVRKSSSVKVGGFTFGETAPNSIASSFTPDQKSKFNFDFSWSKLKSKLDVSASSVSKNSFTKTERRSAPSFSIPRNLWHGFAWQKFCLFFMPIALVLVALCALTAIVTTNPSRFTDYFSFIGRPTLSYPAAGIGLRDLQWRQVSLDNGERLNVFSGVFFNNSNQDVRNPLIEAIVFNEAGEVISRTKSTLTEDLSGVNLQSLDLQTLSELPKSMNRDNLIFAPSVKQNFVFAVNNDLISTPAYFAGRVYSVS